MSDDLDDKTPLQTLKQVTENDDGGGASHIRQEGKTTAPLHLTTMEEQESDARYYRIQYQGVVALLSEPHAGSTKSGAYVCYGEVVMSRHEVLVGEEEDSTFDDSALSAGISPRNSSDLLYHAATTTTTPESPPQSVLSQTAGSVSSLDTLRTASSTAAPSQLTQTKSQVASSVPRRLIRVDQVLTGGYAVDAADASHLEPPSTALSASKQSNLAYHPMVGPSPLPLSDNYSTTRLDDDDASTNTNTAAAVEPTNYGYLYTRKKHVVIAEPLSSPPLLQSGTFLFQIVSSAPLVILTGPCIDAPRTRAMLLPGTVHEVCLKMTTDEYHDLQFLRLSHRRGWITDRRVTALNGVVKIGAVPCAKEVTDSIDADDITVSAISLASASITSTGSSVRRRHRPPRRKRESAAPAATEKSSGLPRHIGGVPQTTTLQGNSSSSPMTTPQKSFSPGRTHAADTKIPTPSSNISILSEDESFDLGGSYRFPTGLTPDRSQSLTRKRHSQEACAPTFFLMHVNAPRGLKILDAPHFQVRFR